MTTVDISSITLSVLSGPETINVAFNTTAATTSPSTVTVTSPITNSGSTTAAQLGINQTLLSIDPSQVTGTAVITSDARLTGMPQNSKSASYTLLLSDAGKHIYVTATGQTITVPANGTVAFPVGTVITVVNAAAVTTSIAITTDTMYLANAGTTGTRTLAAYGVATLIKITSTSWIISGNGLT
jgi:hypothetical protein